MLEHYAVDNQMLEDFKQFGIHEQHLAQGTFYPDKVENVVREELTVTLHLKRLTGSTRNSYLLLIGEINGDTFFIAQALRVLADQFQNIENLNPAKLLSEIAARFGLDMFIEGQPFKFVINRQIQTVLKAPALSTPETFLQSMLSAFQVASTPQLTILLVKPSVEDGYLALDCALACFIDFEAYNNHLMTLGDCLDFEFSIASGFNGQITRLDLLRSVGTFFFVTYYRNGQGHFFRILSKDFHFEAGVDGKSIYLQRNNLRCEIEYKPIVEPNNEFMLFLIWSPTRIQLTHYDATTGKNANSVEFTTPYTRVPQELFDCVDEVILNRSRLYLSTGEFVERINLLLLRIQEIINTHNAYLMFWDDKRVKRKLVRKPKNETSVHPSIAALLNDVIFLNGIDMSRERPTGAGRLDFAFSGTLETGGIVRVCAEFKHAHSADVINGLTVQLPEYMKTMRSEFGIYCVLWFKGGDFAEPKEYTTKDDLEYALHEQAIKLGLTHIRIHIFDLTKQTPPSMLEASQVGNSE